MKTAILLLMMLFFFSGCQKQEQLVPQIIIKEKPICIKQEFFPFGKQIKIRIHPQDKPIYKARIEYLKEGFKFYEDQVKRNNNCLKKEPQEKYK